MTNSLHIANAKGRNASVGISPVKSGPQVETGRPGESIVFRRYLAATETTLDPVLRQQLGDDYAAALIDGDPEVDIEAVGQALAETSTVFIDSSGNLMRNEPHVMEIIYAPDGAERERREPIDTPSNTNETVPIRWTGKKIPLGDAIRRFAFRRTVQLRHVDGLSFDFLYEMATELEREKVVVLVGAGEKGTGPMVFQANGRGYRGFLEGRTDGRRYMLLLHLRDMELKRPTAKEAKA